MIKLGANRLAMCVILSVVAGGSCVGSSPDPSSATTAESNLQTAAVGTCENPPVVPITQLYGSQNGQWAAFCVSGNPAVGVYSKPIAVLGTTVYQWTRWTQPACPSGAPAINLGTWLACHPTVAQHLIWPQLTGSGLITNVPWAQWSASQQDDLNTNFVTYWKILENHGPLSDPDPLVDPPVNQAYLTAPPPPGSLAAILNPTDAWRLYVKLVAMSLAVEVTKYVPWSIVGYDSKSLATLLDGSSLFQYVVSPASGYQLLENSYDSSGQFSGSVSFVVPAPPVTALSFLTTKGVIGATRMATISNALEWTKQLMHFIGPLDLDTFQTTWQYLGPAPVSRTISGTANALWTPSPNTVLHWTAGCHGTSSFLSSVLRVINIPVESHLVFGHSQTHFLSEDLYLSHGDDPYFDFDGFGFPAGPLVSDTLVPPQTLAAWVASYQANAVGIGVPMAMIKFLSGRLMFDYCEDLQNNTATGPTSFLLNDLQNGEFVNIFTIPYLQNLPPDPQNPLLPPSLWDRLAAKVASLGGCTSVLNALGAQQTACEASGIQNDCSL